ncbi:MAG: ester cyclase [Elusimicrobia bacterium]|nr:ester cyclase [Elusimicrobiota bacterium]
MTTHDKAVARRFYLEAVGGGELAHVESLVGADYVDHNAGLAAGRGPEMVRRHLAALRRTFPDFTLQIEDMVAEGDRVATRVSGRGTHLGEWKGIPPTGALIQLRGMNIDRLAGGKIVEHWGEADTVGMLVQMGIDPFAGRR